MCVCGIQKGILVLLRLLFWKVSEQLELEFRVYVCVCLESTDKRVIVISRLISCDDWSESWRKDVN